MKFIYKVGKKLQHLYFKVNMFLKRVWGLPAQTKKDIRIFKAIFDNYKGERIRIFEWGSGLSTMYYAKYLRRTNTDFKWVAIDNNRSWYEKVKMKIEKSGLKEYVHLYVEEFQPFWEKPDWDWENVPPARGIFGPKSESEKQYIDFPKSLNEKFDIVIIDARFRRHCLQVAKEILAPQGVVILHDAQKTHYHFGLEDYPHGKFFKTGEWYPYQENPNEVWVGSVGNNRIFEVLK